jgi:hexosaminidase
LNFKLNTLAAALTVALTACATSNATNVQKALDSTASALYVTTSLVENKISDSKADCPWGFCYKAEITIKNNSKHAVNADWAMYFSSIHRILDTRGDAFKITHIDGDLHKISATDKFTGLKAGEAVTLEYDAEYWQIVDTDFMPNYYITAPGAEARVIENTAPAAVDGRIDLTGYAKAISNDPKKPNQWQRHPGDKTVVTSAQTRFEANVDVADLGVNATLGQIIPTPADMTIQSGSINIAAGLHIMAAEKSIPANQIAALNKHFTKLGVTTNAGVAVNVSVNAANKAFIDKETKGAYTLQVSDSGITVVGADAEGAFYGVESIAALVSIGSDILPKVTVKYDAPRFDYRGMHMDVARNFRSKEQVKEFLDQMAAYKMNKFHFHLADDEGWRLEIPGLPELTDIGAKRCQDLTQTTCLLPQLGSGPDTTTSGSGYYTIADYAEIVAYAQARNIEVIPSMDMPGHSRAAVISMEARYKKYAAEGDMKAAEMYLLTDQYDNSKYLSVQNYTHNTINPCMESSFVFMDKVISEIANIHKSAGQPLTDYHIGADETAGAWVDSPICRAMFVDMSNGIDSASDLGGYFIERISHILAAKNLSLAAWNDGLKHDGKYMDPAKLAGNTAAYAWGTLFWGGVNDAHTLANDGYDVVIATPDVTYFDFPYEADPQEPGYYWGTRNTNSRQVFNFMPENMPANAETMLSRDNGPYEYNADTVALDKGKSFKGIQAHLWSEAIRTDEQQDYMAFPRVLALAERAWKEASWELAYDAKKAYKSNTAGFVGTHHMGKRIAARDAKWEIFANTVGYKELAKLDAAGIAYRLPVPGAMIDKNGLLIANSTFPGLTIQYSNDGKTWMDYDLSSKPKVKAGVQVRTVATTGRPSRAVEVK